MKVLIIILAVFACTNLYGTEKADLKNNNVTKDSNENKITLNNDNLNLFFTFLLLLVNTCLFANAYNTSKRQAKEMKETLDINKKMFIASQRPWVIMKEIKIRGAFNINDFISMTYVIKNVGKSPASNVIWNSMTHLPHMKKIDECLEQLINEKEKSMQHFIDNRIGLFLAPGEEIEVTTSFRYDAKEYENALKVTAPYNYLILFIIGHISYKFDIDNSLHESRFIYQVGHKDHYYIFPSQCPIPMEKIEIKPFGSGFSAT